MKVLEHGIYYQENRIVDCTCGCKFEYEAEDIKKDSSLAYCTCPQQFETYVICPECNSRIKLGKIVQTPESNYNKIYGNTLES